LYIIYLFAELFCTAVISKFYIDYTLQLMAQPSEMMLPVLDDTVILSIKEFISHTSSYIMTLLIVYRGLSQDYTYDLNSIQDF
jgi:hypothetical protein